MDFWRPVKLSHFVILCLLIVFSACSGGGGSGDGGGSSGGSSSGGSSQGTLRRSSSTGVRIVHAAVDAVPFDLVVNGKTIQSAHFAEPTFFRSVTPGDVALQVVGTNVPTTVIFDETRTFARATEYTILIYGSSRAGNLRAQIFEEPIGKPSVGTTRITLAHGFSGGSDLSLVVAGKTIGPVDFGTISSGEEVPSGSQTVQVVTKRGGVLLQETVDAIEQGELLVVATGDDGLNVVFAPVFQDLD